MIGQYYLDKVADFRALFDMNQPVETHEKLYQEESKEFENANTLELQADGLADMVVIMAGWCCDHREKLKDWPLFISNIERMAEVRGINLKAAFDIVNISNRSKACISGDEAVQTLQKYSDMGVDAYQEQTLSGLFAIRSRKDHEGDLSDFVKNKLLKSVNYHKPDWSRPEWRLNPTT